MTPTRPRLAKLAASAGNEGRIPENVVLASVIATGAVARGANLGFQERAGLIDQLRNLWIVGVRLVYQQPGRFNEPGQLGARAIGRNERLVKQLSQPGVTEAVDQGL